MLFFWGPSDRTKPVALYEAICRYAQSRHSSEFFGAITKTDTSSKMRLYSGFGVVDTGLKSRS